MTFVAAVAVMLLSHAVWHPVALTRNDGDITAVVTYEQSNSSLYVHNAHLTVLRHRSVLIARKLVGLEDGTISLHFKNVWGTSTPEVLVEASFCGNRCLDSLYVGVLATGGLAHHDFEAEPSPSAWSLQRHDGSFQFITDDGRFFCVFSDCASSSTPTQVLAINVAGTGFLDVTRSRPDLLLADSKEQWKGYLEERKPGSTYDPLGTLVPYCADEYRLGVDAYCDRVLPASIKRQLIAWGYR